MKNIVFSTTRQWNCGDEFVLFGCINLLKKCMNENFNAIIYNRHPDILHELVNNDRIYESQNLSLRDNSLKHYMDASFIDLVVFAGTPEWSNYHCEPLYRIIKKYNLPVIAIGIGMENLNDNSMVISEIEKFRLLTVREKSLTKKIIEHPSVYLPCPSIAAANKDAERLIDNVKKIAFIYSGDISRSVIWNCVSTETYAFLIEFYKKLIDLYSSKYEFSLICHYADELPYATAEFPNVDCLYSFDSKDYFDLYRKHDFVIGCRVHGIGICASMGIPGIGIAHDFRSGTLEGFLAETISNDIDFQVAISIFEKAISTVSEKSEKLLLHKNKVICEYIQLIQEKTKEIFSLPGKSVMSRIMNPQDTGNHLGAFIWKINNILQNTKVELENTKVELENTCENLNALLNSKSWKITRPLRFIMNMIRRCI